MPETVNLSEKAQWKYTGNITNHRCERQSSSLEIYAGLQNPSHSHYGVVLQFDESGQLLDQDRPRQQTMMQQHDYQITDLTDESCTTPMQQHVYFPYNKNDMQSPTLIY